MVGHEALLQGVGVVVGALNEGLSSDVVLHVILGGVEDAVVRASGSRVNETSGDTGNEEGIVDLELDGVVELVSAVGQHLVESLSLGNSTGESIEDESAGVLLDNGIPGSHLWS